MLPAGYNYTLFQGKLGQLPTLKHCCCCYYYLCHYFTETGLHSNRSSYTCKNVRRIGGGQKDIHKCKQQNACHEN